MINPLDLTGKRILVSGASSGIGRATAVLLSQLGASVVITGRDESRLQETSDMLEGGGHCSIALELRDFEKYGDFFKEVRETGDRLSGFVHCAGIAKVIPLKVMSNQNLREMFEVNFFSFMELVKHYAKKNNSSGGSIVGISAVNAHYPQKCMSAYAATKGAVEMAAASLAVELYDKGIRVNTVVPGPIATPMAASFEESAGDESNLSGRQLMELGEPEDIAYMAAYLLSDAAKFITGRNMYVDGGRL